MGMMEADKECDRAQSRGRGRTLSTSSKTSVFSTPGTKPAPIPCMYHADRAGAYGHPSSRECAQALLRASQPSLCRLEPINRPAGKPCSAYPGHAGVPTWILCGPGLPPLSTGDSAGSTATTLTSGFCTVTARATGRRSARGD